MPAFGNGEPAPAGGSAPVGACLNVGGLPSVGASAGLADRPVGASLAGGRLDRYPLAAKVRAYVPLVMAHLRKLGRGGVPVAMRPCLLTLTAPSAMDDRQALALLDTWADMVACNGRGSSVILAEARGERTGARHWHGLVVSWEAERLLAAWWCKAVPGAEKEAQRITPIASCCLPLGSRGMEKDIRQVLEYVFRQHTGSEIVAREWLRECWREAEAVSPEADASSAHHGEAEAAVAPHGGPARRKGTTRPAAKRVTSGGRAVGRICEYCGGAFEGRRRDARYCRKSCRNMASRKKGKERGRTK